jgi:hypothetical protein
MLRGLLAGIFLLLAAAAQAAPAIDGTTNIVACGAGSPPHQLTLSPLTTTQSQDTVIVNLTEGAADTWAISIADTAGLSYQRRATLQSSSIPTDREEEWYAPAPSPLTGDVITINFYASNTGGCLKGQVFAISGATWPSPFDPLWSQPKVNVSSGTQSFTTSGTDDLLYAHYVFIGCTGPLPGAGWTSLAGTGGAQDLYEYQTVSGAQSGTVATVGAGCTSTQTSILDAFAAADGLGAAQQMTKAIGFIAFVPGMQFSKGVGFIAMMPGASMSKAVGFIGMQSSAPVGTNLKSGFGLFHGFPP